MNLLYFDIPLFSTLFHIPPEFTCVNTTLIYRTIFADANAQANRAFLHITLISYGRKIKTHHQTNTHVVPHRNSLGQYG